MSEENAQEVSENLNEQVSEEQDNKKTGYIDSYEAWVAAGKDPEMYKGRKAWEKDGELIDTVAFLKRRDREREELIRGIYEDHEKLKLKIKEDAVREYKKLLHEAASIGDTEKVAEITDKISDAKAEIKSIEHSAKHPQQQVIDPEVEAFVQRNSSWFRQPGALNHAMTEYAVNRAGELMQLHPEKTPAEVVRQVEAEVKKQFMNEQPKEIKRVADVESSGATPAPQRGVTRIDQLPEKYQRQAKLLKQTMGDAFKLDSYVKDLKAIGAI